MPTNQSPPTFLTLPPEIRNAIYAYIFVPPINDPIPQVPDIASPIAKALHLDIRGPSSPCSPVSECSSSDESTEPSPRTPTPLDILLTCTKIHHEAHLLALSTSIFHLHSLASQPEQFALLTQPLSTPKLSALKHLTLTARITQLRALNETWDGRPFACSTLNLATLTLVPRRPSAVHTAWAEVAELDQCHTLAHVLAETLKTLGRVEEVRVMNSGCFGEGVWKLVYRHLVFKVWKWGGRDCGVRFECSSGAEGEVEGGWFRAFLGEAVGEGEGCKGRDAAVEAYRLLGAEGTSPGAVAGMP